MNRTLYRLCRFLDKEVSVRTVLLQRFYYVSLRLTTPFFPQDCRSLAQFRASRSKRA